MCPVYLGVYGRLAMMPQSLLLWMSLFAFQTAVCLQGTLVVAPHTGLMYRARCCLVFLHKLMHLITVHQYYLLMLV